MQKFFSYKTVTSLIQTVATWIQLCNKNVTDLLQDCIIFVTIPHRSDNKSITILQQNRIAYFEQFSFLAANTK